VQHEGRIKPLDTVARNSLLVLQGKQSIEGMSPIEWLLEMTMAPGKSGQHKIFRVDHPDLLGMIRGTAESKKYVSMDELEPHLEELRKLATTNTDDPYDQAVQQLWRQITLYFQLNNTLQFIQTPDFPLEIAAIEELMELKERSPEFSMLHSWFLERYQYLDSVAYFQVIPTDNGWQSMGKGVVARLEGGEMHPAIAMYAKLIGSYNQNDAKAFDEAVDQLRSSTVSLEVYFNQMHPFYYSSLLYAVAFLLAVISWIIWPKRLSQIATCFLLFAFLLHTFGLGARMWIEERPPVTNLYSSAVFVGWCAVLIGYLLERIYRNGFGTVVAAVIGGSTLIIAHHLGGKGDTMEMMRAVLNSNFWLSTHVVTITIGYSSMFIAGFIGAISLIRARLDASFRQNWESVGSMVFGIVCFSTFLSFVGTVLGGIWADQSWGRFWGWDPKENGALMIVLWNAIILHARLAKMIGVRGLMQCAVFGNIVTSFSWFGVNMLGVGLHSYGFIDQAFFWLILFVVSQLVVIGIGFSVRMDLGNEKN